MIRFVDSCSSTNQGYLLQYQHELFAFGCSFAAGREPSASTNGAYYSFNCSAIYTKVLDYQAHWRNSFSIYVPAGNNSPTAVTEYNMWSWGNGPGSAGIITTVSLTKTGHLRIYVDGDGRASFGTLIYQSQNPLAVGWSSVDIDWYFPLAARGWCSLYINDVLDTINPGGPSANNVNWGGVQPDRFSLVMYVGGNAPGTGWVICDIVVSDAQGTLNNLRIGPCRVKFYPFTQDQAIQWGKPFPHTLASTYLAISEYPGNYPSGGGVAPDLNTSYITCVAADQENLYGIASVDCYAKVLAVALSCCVEDPAGGGVDLVVRPSPAGGNDFIMGIESSPTTYGIVQGIAETNPLIQSGWVDLDIANAWWGVQAISGTPRVTQLFIEKVTTRRAVPYSCGLGSYCVGSNP